MKRPWRLALVVSVLSALLGGLSYACPNWTMEVGLDFWNLATYQAELDEQELLHEELEQREAAVHRALAFRLAVTRDVVEGRMTFDEGVDEFLAFNEADPERREAAQTFFPATTLQESCRQQMLSFVASHVGNSVEACESLSAELRHELMTYRRSPLH